MDTLQPEHQETVDFQTVLELNDIIHSPARLDILIFLLPRKKATFSTIQRTLHLTRGNLGSHLKKLNTHKLIIIEKMFVDEKLTTIVSICPQGKQGIQEYALSLSSILKNTLKST